jgi:hypothetical protein
MVTPPAKALLKLSFHLEKKKTILKSVSALFDLAARTTGVRDDFPS